MKISEVKASKKAYIIFKVALHRVFLPLANGGQAVYRVP